jgi:hypothetical protein
MRRVRSSLFLARGDYSSPEQAERNTAGVKNTSRSPPPSAIRRGGLDSPLTSKRRCEVRHPLARKVSIVLLTSVSVEMVQRLPCSAHRLSSLSQRQPRWRCAPLRPPRSRSRRSRAMTASSCSPTRSVSTCGYANMSPDKLVYMAHQIGKFFAHQARTRRSPVWQSRHQTIGAAVAVGAIFPVSASPR